LRFELTIKGDGMMKYISTIALLICIALAAQAGEKVGPAANEVQAVLDKGVAYLKNAQAADGSFAAKIAGPGVPALVAAGLLRNGMSVQEPLVSRTLQYMESQVKNDGGIYDKGLANYTTSVALMAFREANAKGKYDGVIKNAANFLRGIQEDDVDEKHAVFGGFGYDKNSRPDLSNTAFALDALVAAGISKDDPAMKRALIFISRCQNLPGEFNDQPFAQKTTEEDKGGFTYTPLDPEKNRARTPAGGLRSMGAMTYSGLKSFLYAGVSKDDPRVKAAVKWIRAHYTLAENPGMGQAGLYYYYHTFAKAMDALGEDYLIDAAGKKHDWRRELFDELKKRQQADGSWRNVEDRAFGEASPELATAFALLTLSYCKKE
jgi:squalene-hopene/tetraprenyl-beta-curcumene cyclase